jgi:hypothetical protein
VRQALGVTFGWQLCFCWSVRDFERWRICFSGVRGYDGQIALTNWENWGFLVFSKLYTKGLLLVLVIHAMPFMRRSHWSNVRFVPVLGKMYPIAPEKKAMYIRVCSCRFTVATRVRNAVYIMSFFEVHTSDAGSWLGTWLQQAP